MFSDIEETIELDGFTLTATLQHDSDHGAPWDEEDGHGPVSEWTTRAKRPGELILNSDRGSHRFYDFQAAIALAKRDGWDAEPIGEGTRGDRALRAVNADFDRLRRWCSDHWHYVGVVVTASRNGVELGRASLWGIESDAGDYLVEVANELTGEALGDAREALASLCDCVEA